MRKSIKAGNYNLLVVVFIISCRGTGALLGYGSPRVEQELVDPGTFRIEVHSTDETYGYSPTNPIMVGGAGGSDGPVNERRFLNALSGPNGEAIQYERAGSCCTFTTTNSPFGDSGLLDVYKITYDDLLDPIQLYINMYDSDTLSVPVGFTLRY